MPTMMYSLAELKQAIRLGWVTGLRDASVALQGQPLDEAQVAKIARFALDPAMLRATVTAVLAAQKQLVVARPWSAAQESDEPEQKGEAGDHDDAH